MSDGLTYTYEDLIAKSEGIRTFAKTMTVQLENTRATSEELESNYHSDYSRQVINAIDKVNESVEEFKDAIKAFADAIHDEIAPAYKAVEQKLEDAATNPSSYYGG
jgi:hypothetical protein